MEHQGGVDNHRMRIFIELVCGKTLNRLDAEIGIDFHNNPSYEVGMQMKAENV